MTGDPTDSDDLDERLAQRLIAAGQTVATAESCTGGLIAKRLTDRSGSSAYFLGGAVAYSNVAKQRVFGVPEQFLIVHGAVSEPVARAMADGARHLFGTDFALSVTGIAGPTGGTETKPVGLTFVGLSAANGVWVRRFVFEGTRAQNRDSAANAALILLLDHLDGAL
jgi:PncC family amidohydrolase